MSNLPPHAETLHIRLRAADREVITARATRAGLTVSEYMRRAGLGTLGTIVQPRIPVVSEPRPAAPEAKGNAALHRFLASADGDDPA